MSVFDRISAIQSKLQRMHSQFSGVNSTGFNPSSYGPRCLNPPSAQTFEQLMATASSSSSSSISASSHSYSGCEQDFNNIIKEASQKYGVEEELVRAIIKQESGFNPNAVSCAGAQGLMQLMPETAKGLGVADPMDPRDNVMGGVKYIKQMLDRYDGNKTKALAAYNAGPGNVDHYGGVPPFSETQNYVNNILSMYQEYKKS